MYILYLRTACLVLYMRRSSVIDHIYATSTGADIYIVVLVHRSLQIEASQVETCLIKTSNN